MFSTVVGQSTAIFYVPAVRARIRRLVRGAKVGRHERLKRRSALISIPPIDTAPCSASGIVTFCSPAPRPWICGRRECRRRLLTFRSILQPLRSREQAPMTRNGFYPHCVTRNLTPRRAACESTRATITPICGRELNKGRALFAAEMDHLEDMSLSRRIGGLLGNDLGQMRVQFNARTYVVEPVYRDDGLGLWDFGDQAQPQVQAIHPPDDEGVVAALSLLCASPVQLVESLLQNRHYAACLVLCKAVGLKWQTVRTILTCRSINRTMTEHDLNSARTEYDKLSQSSAQRILRFWQVKYTALNKVTEPATSTPSLRSGPKAQITPIP